MGKRSDFERIERDFYPTIDPSAIEPVKQFLTGKSYYEPCCGEGHLIDLLSPFANCIGSSDLEKDALTLKLSDLIEEDETGQIKHHQYSALFVTNPPYKWKDLEPLLSYLPTIFPTMLLLPSDVMHNKRMGKFMKQCRCVWSVGRLYWQGNKIRGKDNYAWFLFTDQQERTRFIGR